VDLKGERKMGRDISKDEIEAKVIEHVQQWPSRKLTVEIEYVDTNDVKEVLGICLKSVKIIGHKDQRNGEALACYAAVAGTVSRIISDIIATIDNMPEMLEMVNLVREFTYQTSQNVQGILDIQSYKDGL
jgi:hypothetical protein